MKQEDRELSEHQDKIRQMAGALLSAYNSGAIAPIREHFAAGDVASAYAIQQIQVAEWQATGRRPVGRKIGLTNKAVQAQLGVGEPDYGYLFADMVYGDGDEVPFSRLQQPRVEAEIAFLLKEDLPYHDASVADVVRAIDWVLPSIEIVGSRIAGWDIRIVDTIADNASSGLLALGGPARRLDGLDLVECAMSLSVNGKVVSTGWGRDCLGGPLNAVAWLARRAASFGEPLRAGELILSGALGPMVGVQAGDRVEASIDGIGRVGFSLSA